MGTLYIVRRPQRQAFFLPLGGTPQKPNTIIPFYGVDRQEMDFLVRALCEKHGISGVESLVDQAEAAYQERVKVAEASRELHMRVREQAEFSKLKYGGLKPPRKRSQK